MVNAKQVTGYALALGGVGVAGYGTYKLLTAIPPSPPPPPPGKYRLTIKALADSMEIAVNVTVDHITNPTPISLDLDPGTYTLTAPDEVIIAGEEYYFKESEET